VTPDQIGQLNSRLAEVLEELRDFSIEFRHDHDTATANQLISDTRTKLSHIDHRLFQCYKLLDQFMYLNRPAETWSQPPRRTPTIDDLEI